MGITAEEVRITADMARLALSDEELERLPRELSAILEYMADLAKLDTDGVEPMTSCVEMGAPMRDDVVTDGNKRDLVLANAPKAADGFFVVPKVVE